MNSREKEAVSQTPNEPKEPALSPPPKLPATAIYQGAISGNHLHVETHGGAVEIGHKIILTREAIEAQHQFDQAQKERALEAEKEELPIRLRNLQTSLHTQYEQYDHLERLFDERKTSIVDSFINLALIKETEQKQKEKSLGRDANLEEKDKNEKEFIDERMASHEELYAVKEPLALNQLFEPKDDTKTPNKILILGRAGIGKSILCQYLAVQWASESKDEQREEIGNYLRQKFDAVFWVKLREVAAAFPHHNTVAKVIHQFCLRGLHKPSLEELDFYIKSQNDKVLFILDGYDEITDSIGQAHGTHLTDSLNEIANYQHVLVTSRPLAIDALGQNKIKFDRKLENIGFTNENIEAYVRHFMRDAEKPNQAEPMLKFLRTRPSIWGIAHIPINLELLSWLWSQGDLVLEQGQTMTLSKLYQTIVTRVQGEYAKKFNLLQANLLEESKEGESSSTDIANEFLEYLAYSAMQQESLLIPKSQLTEALTKILKKHRKPNSLHDQEIVLKSATDQLGFLRATGQGGRSQLDQPHYFIHLSFQEFYAAKYITRVLSHPIENEEKTCVIQHIITEKYMPRYQLMLWMTAGLLYQQGVEKGREFSALEQFWKAILSEPRDRIGFHHMVLVMHCLDECEADDHLPVHKMLIDQQLQWSNFYIRHYPYKEYTDELARCPLLQGSKLMIDHMLKNLKDENEEVRHAAVSALGKLQNPSSEVVNVLLTAFKDEDEYVRSAAASALSKLQNPSGEVVNALLTAFKDEDEYVVRGAAASALGRLQNPNPQMANVVLLIALEDENEEVRRAAVCALGQFQNPSAEAVNVLLTALKDENEKMRRAAVCALGKFQNPSAEVVNALVTALTDENKYVRWVAAFALGKLQNLSPEAINALVTALKDEDKYVKEVAAFALGNLQNLSPEAINALVTALKDKDEGMRQAAAFALGKLQNLSPEAINALLVTALKDEADGVRHAAASALDNLQNLSPEGVNAIVTALKDKGMRQAAAFALHKLQNLSPEGVNVLVTTALTDEDKAVKRATASALANFKKIDHLRIIFGELMYHQSLEAYLSEYFEKNYLLCIDHENKQIILSLHNKIHTLSFQLKKDLIHLENQIKAIAKQKGYPLDILYPVAVQRGSSSPTLFCKSNHPAERTPKQDVQKVQTPEKTDVLFHQRLSRR